MLQKTRKTMRNRTVGKATRLLAVLLPLAVTGGAAKAQEFSWLTYAKRSTQIVFNVCGIWAVKATGGYGVAGVIFDNNLYALGLGQTVSGRARNVRVDNTDGSRSISGTIELVSLETDCALAEGDKTEN